MQKGFQTVNLHGCASGTIATPIIGENENWWIGNDDTGISARGVEGPKGETGAKGDKGDKGDAGAQGPQGIQGPQGEQGVTGEVDPAELERIEGKIVEIRQSVNSVLTLVVETDYVEIVKSSVTKSNKVVYISAHIRLKKLLHSSVPLLEIPSEYALSDNFTWHPVSAKYLSDFSDCPLFVINNSISTVVQLPISKLGDVLIEASYILP